MPTEPQPVHCLEEVYPQLSEGIADHLDKPHLFRRLDEQRLLESSTQGQYELFPVSPEVVAAAIEVSGILHRWLEKTGSLWGFSGPLDEFGAFPEDLGRRKELRAFLDARYAEAVQASRIIVHGEFLPCNDSASGYRVRWMPTNVKG